METKQLPHSCTSKYSNGATANKWQATVWKKLTPKATKYEQSCSFLNVFKYLGI